MLAVEFLLLIQSDYHLRDGRYRVPEDYAVGSNEKREINKYFQDRRRYDSSKINQQDVEGLMRYCETLTHDDYYDYYNHLKRKYLHKHLNPVPKPADNLEIPTLKDHELQFFKDNVKGMENVKVTDGTGYELMAMFLRLRHLCIAPAEIKLRCRQRF